MCVKTEHPRLPRLLVSATTLLCGSMITGLATAGDLAVGLGGGYSLAEYKGMDDGTGVIPFVHYEIGRFSFYPLGASMRLATFASSPGEDAFGEIGAPKYQLQLHASIDLADDERDNDDSIMFTGMETRELGSTASIKADLETPFGQLSLSHISDIADASTGSISTLAYGIPLYSGQSLFIGGNIGAHLVNSKWNDYYYGVRASESTATRSAYQASQGVNAFMEISAGYAFTQHWSMNHSVSVAQLDDTVVDSPLTVDDDIRSEYGVMFLYSY